MAQPAIRVTNLSKHYAIGAAAGQYRYSTLRDVITHLATAPIRRAKGSVRSATVDGTFWALRELTFAVAPGEVLGIVGRNGAGKSTLLKILSRVTQPTQGYVELRGRVASLLEVGTGFHPELTGRENIYLNGSILGMTRREIHRNFDEIVAFAEVERFIDTPVKRYSSGMYLRLAFAVAAHLEPEILLVDEVLAVGDAEFQKKCLGKMGSVAREGRTVILVSHNMAAILRLCSAAVLLDRGTLISAGDSKDVVDRYLKIRNQVASQGLAVRQDRQGNQRLRLLAYELRDSMGSLVPRVCTGQEIAIAFQYRAGSAPLRDVHLAIGVHGSFDENLFHLSTEASGLEFETAPSLGEMVCHIPSLPLQPGRYSFNVYCTVAGEVADWIQDAGIIEVEQGDFFASGKLPPLQQGPFVVQHSWHVTPSRELVYAEAEP